MSGPILFICTPVIYIDYCIYLEKIMKDYVNQQQSTLESVP